MQESNQIAEWLEELKSLKENSISKEAFEKMKSKSYKKGHRQAYKKAIDDFEERLSIAFDETDIEEYGFYPKNLVRSVAEQLKAGGENGNLRR